MRTSARRIGVGEGGKVNAATRSTLPPEDARATAAVFFWGKGLRKRRGGNGGNVLGMGMGLGVGGGGEGGVRSTRGRCWKKKVHFGS